MKFTIIISICIILNSCKSSNHENVPEMAKSNASESVVSVSQMEFIITLMQLPNWEYGLFTEHDFEKYNEAIIDFRSFTDDERVEIFRSFQNKVLSDGDDGFARRLYIFIRMHFLVEDLEYESFVGFGMQDQNNLNNLWPLEIENNKFRMIAKYEGAEGLPYVPLTEYSHYVEKTKERKIFKAKKEQKTSNEIQ